MVNVIVCNVNKCCTVLRLLFSRNIAFSIFVGLLCSPMVIAILKKNIVVKEGLECTAEMETTYNAGI